VNDNVDVSVGSLNGAQNEVMHDAADLGLLDVAIIVGIADGNNRKVI